MDDSGPRIDECVVIVTGAAGGIGSAVVRRLDQAGASVIANVREFVGEVVDGAKIVVEADLCAADTPGRLIDAGINEFGRINGLVNCAGIQTVEDFLDISDEAWTEMIDTNLSAAHRLTAAAAKSMIDTGHHGSVVHVGSIEGSRPSSGHAHYSVSKAGLIMHARASALELGRHGIRVNSVSPGLIGRPGLEDTWPDGVERWISNDPLGRLGTGAEVADACLFLLSDMSLWITGVDLAVDGGMSASPSW